MSMIKQSLDITQEHCPMTFVKARLALEKLAAGDQLEVFLSEGEPLQSVPRSATEQGYKVLEVAQVEGTRYRVLFEK
jgi:tRNA 2-thiouridine synthesizing protein A